MKKLFSIITFIAFAAVAIAQTPQEIISRMEAEMNKQDESEGVAMTMDIKVIILGTMTSRIYTLGDKTRVEASMLGKDVITWNDGDTEWTYNSENAEIEIKKATPKQNPIQTAMWRCSAASPTAMRSASKKKRTRNGISAAKNPNRTPTRMPQRRWTWSSPKAPIGQSA